MKVDVVLLAAAAGAAGVMACSARAEDPGLLTGDHVHHGRVVGHVYINAATGERRVTPAHGSRMGEVFWDNSDVAGACQFFYGMSRPGEFCDPEPCPQPGVVNWGDLPAGSLMDGYEVAYATNVGCDTLGTGVSGLNMVNAFYDGYDGELDPGGSGATGVAGFLFESIPGGDCSLGTSMFAGWILTIDLEGTGFEVTFGDADLDGDGLHDFAYGYSFEQPEPVKGIVGPFLVRPASLGGLGTATGCPDQLDFFRDEFDDYAGGFWFGGGDCSIPRPYASLYMRLLGTSGGSGFCSRIDYNEDGIVDFGDYLEFLNRFDGMDPSADLNGDGIVDFSDYLEFLNLFDMCAD